MSNKKFKLIGTAIGLVAVLVMGLAMPGVTQDGPVPTRGQIVKGLSQLLVTLTASEGDILDVENAEFISHPIMTSAHIPLHPSSRSVQLLVGWLAKDEPFGDFLNLGAIYVGKDFPGCPGYDRLTTGIYQLKVTKDLKLIAIDPTGNEFTIGYVKVERPASSIFSLKSTTLAPTGWGWVVLLAICAFTDPQICTTTRQCVPIIKPDGSSDLLCWDDIQCWGC